MDIPAFIKLSFITLTLALFVALLLGLNYSLKKLEKPKRKACVAKTGIVIILWFCITGFLTVQGFFSQWDKVPPRVFLAVVVPVISILFIARRKGFTELINQIPQEWIVYLQSFRILIEVILWMLFIEKIIPIQMTFEGLNFDVVTGITALLVGYYGFQKGKLSKSVLIGWNVLGLVLVTTIVIIAALSTPFPFRVFMNEPANTMIAHLPFIWLPAFVVPVAYFLHVVSLKQLMSKNN